MSTAEPMSAERRIKLYRYPYPTRRQARRWRHKVHRHGYVGVPYSIGKGRETPRQSKPRRDE